jgi:hypothetical protein
VLRADRRPRQTGILAQRAAFVAGEKESAPPQLREHQRVEVVEAARERRRHHVEAVRAVVHEALFELVRDLLGRTDQLPAAARAGDPQIQFAQGQVFAPRRASSSVGDWRRLLALVSGSTGTGPSSG